MAEDQWESRKRKGQNSGTEEGPQDWMTPFEKKVCDTKNHHGFTRAALAKHGVKWPPPKGWRAALKAMILARGGASAEPTPAPQAPVKTKKPQETRRMCVTSYEVDRERLDLAGFAEVASMRVNAGPNGTVVVEQSGFFAVSMSRGGRERASRYIIVKKSAIPDLIKDLRAIARPPA